MITILVADGGSTDDTVAKCRAYGAEVHPNPLVRCEPGVSAMMDLVHEGLIVVFAADNWLLTKDHVRRVAAPFSDPLVGVAFCSIASDVTQGSLTNRYLNRFTDPFNHFIYWEGADYANLHRTHPEAIRGRIADHTVLFRFAPDNCPLVALAQGATIRARYQRPKGTDEDDVLPLLDIARNADLAYVKTISVGHSSVSGLTHFLKKFGPRFRAKLNPSSEQMTRVSILSRQRRIRRALWPFYALSMVLPLAAAAFMAVTKRERLWLYHPIISFALACSLVRELVRVGPGVCIKLLRPTG